MPLPRLDLAPLQQYRGPIDAHNVNWSSGPVSCIIEIPTLKSVSSIGNHKEIQLRRTQALEIGSAAVGKQFLVESLVPSRRLFRSVFPDQLKLLDYVINCVERFSIISPSSIGYRVHERKFCTLVDILSELCSIAADTFKLRDTQLPQVPSWGNRSHILDVYSENDFEILSVCFRAEVENFLVLLDRTFDFVAYQQRKPDVTAPAIESGMPRGRKICSSRGTSFPISANPTTKRKAMHRNLSATSLAGSIPITA